MKKIFLTFVFSLLAFYANAQYNTVNAILDRLEEDRGVKQNLKNENLDNKKFVIVKDFEDHTERTFIVIKGNDVTYIEMFDDKANGQTSSNVFTGDLVKTKSNLLSFRFDKLEGEKIALPITKTMMLGKQKKILYLIDVNTKERWIDEKSF